LARARSEPFAGARVTGFFGIFTSRSSGLAFAADFVFAGARVASFLAVSSERLANRSDTFAPAFAVDVDLIGVNIAARSDTDVQSVPSLTTFTGAEAADVVVAAVVSNHAGVATKRNVEGLVSGTKTGDFLWRSWRVWGSWNASPDLFLSTSATNVRHADLIALNVVDDIDVDAAWTVDANDIDRGETVSSGHTGAVVVREETFPGTTVGRSEHWRHHHVGVGG
jgi:hypothetical protein